MSSVLIPTEAVAQAVSILIRLHLLSVLFRREYGVVHQASKIRLPFFLYAGLKYESASRLVTPLFGLWNI